MTNAASADSLLSAPGIKAPEAAAPEPVKITPDMIGAGAAIIEWRGDTATHEELAELVYKAMASAGLERDDF